MKKTNNREINDRVFAYRRMRRIRQKDMAEMLGMVPSTYSQLEREGQFKAEILFKVSKILDISIYTLLGQPEPQSGAPLMARQKVDNLEDNGYFVTTRKEQNIIMTYRALSKEDRDEVMAFITEKRQNAKNKKA